MLVAGDRVERRPVRVLFQTAMEAWIWGDLESGDLVVVGDLDQLKEGQTVSFDSPQLAAMP